MGKEGESLGAVGARKGSRTQELRFPALRKPSPKFSPIRKAFQLLKSQSNSSGCLLPVPLAFSEAAVACARSFLRS